MADKLPAPDALHTPLLVDAAGPARMPGVSGTRSFGLLSAGYVPALKTGCFLLFNPEAAECVLLARARNGADDLLASEAREAAG